MTADLPDQKKEQNYTRHTALTLEVGIYNNYQLIYRKGKLTWHMKRAT